MTLHLTLPTLHCNETQSSSLSTYSQRMLGLKELSNQLKTPGPAKVDDVVLHDYTVLIFLTTTIYERYWLSTLIIIMYSSHKR